VPKPSNVHPISAKASAEAGAALESTPKRSRRKFTAAEKLRILKEAAACTGRGEVEALLRREGIYSSHLSNWRQQFARHGSEGMGGAKPGRKPKLDAKDRRIQELERKTARLERELLISQKLIELQKKAHEVLGIALPTLPTDEDD
jgi:transposase-like protein